MNKHPDISKNNSLYDKGAAQCNTKLRAESRLIPYRLAVVYPRLALKALLLGLVAETSVAADGVFVRIQLAEPTNTAWYVKLAGYIHREPWHLPDAIWPSGADKDPARRVAPGQPSPWFDLGAHAGEHLHSRLQRSGGVAEFPNVTMEFIGGGSNPLHRAVIDLATAPDDPAVIKRLEETFNGAKTSFLVSPNLRADSNSLETASQITARHVSWARAATGGRRIAPTNLLVQTQFWAPQRPELNLQEAEVLWLLGFNLVGSATAEVLQNFPFVQPAGHSWVDFGPALDWADIKQQIAKPASKIRSQQEAGSNLTSSNSDLARSKPAAITLYNFSDEIACRPPIGNNPKALTNFHFWLKQRNLSPAQFGVQSIDDVVPIESPVTLRERQKTDRAPANRTFVWTTRFRQASAAERLKWLTEAFHQDAPTNVLTSTLVADHPYFAGSGFGMGMNEENKAWGGFPLSLDWFALARERVVDVIGIEDWLGLKFMYGPSYTWEGFQLIGFQATICRSGSKGQLPIITWITPSDETNLRLKTASALCQGAKHFFYWTYGPTATSTENYWSDLRGEHDGIATITRQLAGAEKIISAGRTRAARVALVYSLSSDLWQPFGYLTMAERRLTYFSLIHDQYLVDLLTEQDLEEGRLRDYDALYLTDPCVSTAACAAIRKWVLNGGSLYGSSAAATRNEFNEEQSILAEVFGHAPLLDVQVQAGRFDLRGALNDLNWLDQMHLAAGGSFGAIGVKVKPGAAARISAPRTNPPERRPTVIGAFNDGTPAVLSNHFGKGSAVWVGTCPALSYAKDAHFVAAELKEKWPAGQREFINTVARTSGAQRLVELSHPVVEAGVFEAPAGAALVLANFTYEPISHLKIRLPFKQNPHRVHSLERGPLGFQTERASRQLAAQGYPRVVNCAVNLGLNDILLIE